MRFLPSAISVFRKSASSASANSAKPGKTIVMVTHIMANLQRICERAVLIDHGSILVDGTPDEAIALYHNLMNVEVVAAH